MFNLWHAFFYIADTFLNSPNIDKYADKKIFHSLIIYFIFFLMLDKDSVYIWL